MNVTNAYLWWLERIICWEMYCEEEYSTLIGAIGLFAKKQRNGQVNNTATWPCEKSFIENLCGSLTAAKTQEFTPYRPHDSRLPMKYFKVHAMSIKAKRKRTLAKLQGKGGQ